VDDDETRRHVEQVSARIRAIAPPDLREHLLRVAALHERRDPERLPPDVALVVLGFGELWRIADDADLSAFLRLHRYHLRPLLLFELAHEGAATAAMRAAAERGGIADEFTAWEQRLPPTGA
jgi:hypothetical protein